MLGGAERVSGFVPERKVGAERGRMVPPSVNPRKSFRNAMQRNGLCITHHGIV